MYIYIIVIIALNDIIYLSKVSMNRSCEYTHTKIYSEKFNFIRSKGNK